MAVTLRFSKLARPKTSPITLHFGDDGITLNFDQPWLAKTSPITLRFDGSDDTGEPEPEPVPQVLGIALGLGWQAKAAIEQHIALNQYATKAAQRIVTTWHGDKVDVRERFAWASKPLGTRVTLPWQVRFRLLTQTSLRWALPDTRQLRTSIAWHQGKDMNAALRLATTVIQPFICVAAITGRQGRSAKVSPILHGRGIALKPLLMCSGAIQGRVGFAQTIGWILRLRAN